MEPVNKYIECKVIQLKRKVSTPVATLPLPTVRYTPVATLELDALKLTTSQLSRQLDELEEAVARLEESTTVLHAQLFRVLRNINEHAEIWAKTLKG